MNHETVGAVVMEREQGKHIQSEIESEIESSCVVELFDVHLSPIVAI